MKSAVCDSIVAPADYASLSEEDFALRYLAPMLAGLKIYSGTDALHELHLQMTVRELTDLDLALLSSDTEDGN